MWSQTFLPVIIIVLPALGLAHKNSLQHHFGNSRIIVWNLLSLLPVFYFILLCLVFSSKHVDKNIR